MQKTKYLEKLLEDRSRGSTGSFTGSLGYQKSAINGSILMNNYLVSVDEICRLLVWYLFMILMKHCFFVQGPEVNIIQEYIR